METVTESRTAGEAPPQCDQPGCTQAGVYNYAWDWGQKGVCCAEHQFTLQQTSESLARRVNFSPLLAPVAAPITRDERAKLMGAVYAADMEIVDLKSRGSLLYQENTTLTRSLQAKVVRLRETELQLEEARKELSRMQDKLDQKDAEHGDLVEEVTRLRTMEKFIETETDPSRGLESRVD